MSDAHRKIYRRIGIYDINCIIYRPLSNWNIKVSLPVNQGILPKSLLLGAKGTKGYKQGNVIYMVNFLTDHRIQSSRTRRYFKTNTLFYIVCGVWVCVGVEDTYFITTLYMHVHTDLRGAGADLIFKKKMGLDNYIFC